MNKDKKLLLEAIDKAEGFKECKYLRDDEQPCCVIGQLAALHGIEAKVMKKWNTKSVMHSDVQKSGLPLIYGTKILSTLQAIWDDRLGAFSNEEEAKTEMRAEVELYYDAIN